jgi:hypothetical protein
MRPTENQDIFDTILAELRKVRGERNRLTVITILMAMTLIAYIAVQVFLR